MVAFPAVIWALRLDCCAAGYFGLTGNVLYSFGGLDHSAVNLYWVLPRRKSHVRIANPGTKEPRAERVTKRE
jgi:hypothetical protein